MKENRQPIADRTGSADAHEAFWRGQFPNRVAPLSLPFDRPRPPVPSYLRESVDLDLGASLIDGLEALSSQLAVSPLCILVAAFETILFRYTGQKELVLGVASQAEGDALSNAEIGDSVLIPIQSDWNARVDRSGEELVREVSMRLDDARTHAEYPLMELQSWAGDPDSIHGSRLFNVAFSLAAGSGDSGWPMTDPDLGEYLTQCDVVITADPASAGLKLRADFDADLFDEATIRRMLGHLEVLLEGILKDPRALVLRHPILSDRERHELIYESNASPGQYSSDTTLHRQFEQQVERRPDAVAMTCDGVSLTYLELNQLANRVAHALIKSGVGSDVLVGICLERANHLVIAILSILKAGGAYLPIDLAYPAERLSFMLEDAQAPVLLTQSELLDQLPATEGNVICIDQVLAAPLRDGEELNPSPLVGPDNLAYVIYTSGTTGKPKGSLITHRNVARLFPATEHWFRFGENDVWTLFHSCAFDFSVWEIWGALLYGGRLVVVPFMTSRSPESFYRLLAEEKVTILNQTPSAFRQLIQAEEAVGEMELALRFVIFGGEPLEMQSLRPWFDRHGDKTPQLVNMYGITETTVHVTYRPVSKKDLNSGSIIGVPIPDLQIYIVDSELEPVPFGVPGEILVGGAGLARGYLNREQLTEERFIPDHLTGEVVSRLYRTGDLARRLPGREIEYLGRIDQQVKIRGFRIELGEIESVLCQHPAVREVAVVAREDTGNKQLVAYLVVNGEAPALGDLREHLKKQLPDYMVPPAFVILDRFPLTNNGKIDRDVLPEPEQHRPELTERYERPRTEVESALTEIWSRVLRLERVGVRDNFFELGGDSILSIQVISLARQAGLQLTPSLFFQHPTIAEMAKVAQPLKDKAVVEQGLVEGGARLTPIQHWFFEQELGEPNYYNQTLLFTVRQPLELAALKRTLAHLDRHHDALRLRFSGSGYPSEQQFAPPATEVPLDCVDLREWTDEELATAIEEVSIRAQASLDFADGPLWRAVYFDCGSNRPARLLLAIHHLAVDGVSWRILLEDLEHAYNQELAGEPVRLPAKTSSVKEWAERLADYASRGEALGEVKHWQETALGREEVIPVDLSDGENTESSTQTVTVCLEPAETAALLQKAPSTYNTQINDLLVAALVRVMGEWTGGEELFVNLEGHGRADLFEGVDVSRTVGWFTSIYPVLLQSPAGDVADLIKSVKEQLRAVPNHGIGYGLQRYLAADGHLESAVEPQILFNYFGQFDHVVSGSQLFCFADEPVGPWHSPHAHRRHLLDVDSLVIRGRLEMRWTFSKNRHLPQTIEHLASQFLTQLRLIIAHCTAAQGRGGTPSDFPLALLDQDAVDALLTRIPDLEDVYALSPIQTLFFTAGANDSRAVLDHWHATLTGPLDRDCFQRAWDLVFKQHPILRTSFQAAGMNEPVQVVHQSATLPFHYEDWRQESAGAQDGRWSEFLRNDLAKGLTLDEAPLSRLALIRFDDNRFRFLWTAPALLLDGWSWPLVFRDLSLAYEALRQGEPVLLEPARPYRDYVAWWRTRQHTEDERFWRKKMLGVTDPTPLQGGEAETSPLDGMPHPEWSRVLEADVSDRLVQLARKLQITPNTLFQASWAMVLARLSERDDVVFGAAFAGRPTDLPGASGIVGPFVNNLPVRVQVHGESSVRSFLQEFHADLLQINEHQFAPLGQIQSWTDVPWRHRLFESIVVVQNYAVDEAARRMGSAVHISDFVGPIHTNFPLLVLLEPDEAWRISLIHDKRALPASAIERWGADLVRTLMALPDILDGPLDSLMEQLSPPVTRAPQKPRWRAQSLNYVPPQTQLERDMARLWEDMLGLERISIDENVFDLGVHSLLVVRLHQRMREIAGRDFPLVLMFQFPSIHSLAAHLSQDDSGNRSGSIRNRAALQRQALARSRTRR